MTERLSAVRAAYTKGAKAYRKCNLQRSSRTPSCPYGETKKELQSWWNAGYHDASMRGVDIEFYINTKENK